jgi:hypothetical protein
MWYHCMINFLIINMKTNEEFKIKENFKLELTYTFHSCFLNEHFEFIRWLFWDVAPSSLAETDHISEVLTASIIRAMNKLHAQVSNGV